MFSEFAWSLLFNCPDLLLQQTSESSKAELIKADAKLVGKPAGSHAAEQSQDGSPSNTEVLPDPDQACKHRSASAGSFSPAPSEQSKCDITNGGKVGSQSASPVDDNQHVLPAALKPRSKAALKVSTTMFSNLFPRLEAYMHTRTDVHVQEADACLAGLPL